MRKRAAESERSSPPPPPSRAPSTISPTSLTPVPTFQPYGGIEEYAVKMFENGGRGIGQKGKDNGLLVVVAVQDRKIKIETGYDIEGFVPDGYAGQVIRDQITPQFRSGNYGAGLVAGTTAVVNRIASG